MASTNDGLATQYKWIRNLGTVENFAIRHDPMRVYQVEPIVFNGLPAGVCRVAAEAVNEPAFTGGAANCNDLTGHRWLQKTSSTDL